MLELSQPQTLTKNDGEYYTLYPCKGRTRTYTLHFLGPLPDAQDWAESAREDALAAIVPQAA